MMLRFRKTLLLLFNLARGRTIQFMPIYVYVVNINRNDKLND